MKNLVSIFAGHDSNITFFNAKTNTYHIIELERLLKKRYFRLHIDNDIYTIKNILKQCQLIAENNWNIENNYETVLISSDGGIDPVNIVFDIFKADNISTIAHHHMCHAATAFYQSPYEKSLIVSYDGGGDDGFFNIYEGGNKGIKHIEKIDCDFGNGYMLGGSLLKEICSTTTKQLSIPGKLMGLCGYGTVIDDKVSYFEEFFFDKNYKKLNSLTNFNFKNLDNPWGTALMDDETIEYWMEENEEEELVYGCLDNWVFEGKQSYNVAATIQKAFENAFFKVIKTRNLHKKYSSICITGGAALNVLVNEKLKKYFKVFVPPNPSDCGLSLGHMLLYQNKPDKINVTYNGLPLLDKDKLSTYISERGARITTYTDIAKLLKDGKIIGFVYGDSEVGPRALGNRSIVCDPSYPDMKNILNSKVKFREWYRPFAPFCKKEDALLYFDSLDFNNLEYMGFAPTVKEKYKNILPSITHVDGTSRLQTITNTSHNQFYSLLTEFNKISETKVLLNTSFNIRGNPILSTIEDALYVLDNTELDHLVVENYLI